MNDVHKTTKPLMDDVCYGASASTEHVTCKPDETLVTCHYKHDSSVKYACAPKGTDQTQYAFAQLRSTGKAFNVSK